MLAELFRNHGHPQQLNNFYQIQFGHKQIITYDTLKMHYLVHLFPS